MIDRDIVRAARNLRLAVIVVGTILLLAYLTARIGLWPDTVRLEGRFDGATIASILKDLTVVLFLLALLDLTRMLRAIERGELFSTQVIKRFRGFALWLLLFALARVAAPLLIALLAYRPGTLPQIRLDISDLLALGVTLLLFLLARILERARRIEDEMKEII